MFHKIIKNTNKIPLVAFFITLSTISISAQATLTSYTNAGVDLVHSSESNVTWTKDANLFKTMYDADKSLISKIAAVTPTLNDSRYGLRTIDTSDFTTIGSFAGTVSWWGALAYVNYLNSISYGGSNQWHLPTVATQTAGYNTPSNGTTAGNELSELYYQELGSKAFPVAGYGIRDSSNIFTNEQAYAASWSGTESASNSDRAWFFNPYHGGQYDGSKNLQLYAWAIYFGSTRA